MLKRGTLAFILTLVLAVSVGTVNATTSSQSELSGIFGTVLSVSGDHPRAIAGETDIRLDTAKGIVEITTNLSTRIRINGQEQAEVEDIPVGSNVAALASNGRAIAILVIPHRPVSTRHFTGVVTQVAEDGSVGIRDGLGREIMAPSLQEVADLQAGDMVTAVLKQDLISTALLITGLDRASDSLTRIQAALENAQRSNASANLAALSHRLTENSARHLTMLQNLTQTADTSLRPQMESRLASAQRAYAQSMSPFGAGPPAAVVSGIITSIDEERKRVTVQPANLRPVELFVDADANINFRGKEIPFGKMDLANRVQARYELKTRSAIAVIVGSGRVLEAVTGRAILATGDRGEIVGRVIDLDLSSGDEPRVTIQDQASGQTVTVLSAKDSVILSGGTVVELNRDILDTQVTVMFDQGSLEIIELGVLPIDLDQRAATGVVSSFFSKVLIGNMVIQTRDGGLQAFTRTDETVIRRDGRRVSINEVRLGDLVRPNSRLGGASPATLEFLSLKSPRPAAIRGTIRGITPASQSGTRITVLTSELDLVTILVDSGTQLTQQGKSTDIDALSVGQRVLDGSYDPISQRAARLSLQPGGAA